MKCRECGKDVEGANRGKKYCCERCRWKRKTRDYRARHILREAVRKGKLNRPKECSKCGTEPQQTIHGHHPNYDKPLYVIWLCEKCHRNLHCPDWGKN